ncbi:hypothetical protein FSP39_016828 [Pinctada imbricata]|uniref:Kazal-like domain-containing protein n=1 Tax=Pinctada imbricata TaxID=66713 RepID=A0AA88XWZ6_PINIB|nr:hypothetical protein FSP39_016828 [Pinctada imbricata]
MFREKEREKDRDFSVIHGLRIFHQLLISRETMATTGRQTDQMKQLIVASKSCLGDQLAFWQCVNSSLTVVHSISAWSGRPCCDLAANRFCEESCRSARSIQDIEEDCSRSTETSLFKCLLKQEEGEKCCEMADEYNCRLVCQGTFLSDYSRKTQRHILRGQCKQSHSIMQCAQVRTLRRSNGKDSLPCCYEVKDKNCRDTCVQAISTLTNEQEIAKELEASCGPIFPQWKCFLSQDPGRNSNRYNPRKQVLAAARLQCCAQANHGRCGQLCSRTYSTEWNGKFEEFNKQCQDLTTSVSRLEAPMLTCITEVEEPCRIGCDGLQFCTNFNHRPTELFRSCNREADEAAETQYKKWMRDKFIVLPQMRIPVKDIRMCEPEIWKAIACATQIKPCGRKPSSLFICREDCLNILNKCLNQSRIHPDQTVTNLCKILSPDDSSRSCISVKQFTDPSPHKMRSYEVSTPCKPNPCSEGEICWINRNKCRNPQMCPAYFCHKACSMGVMETMLVPRHSYIKIPVYQQLAPSSSNSDPSVPCIPHRVCKCGKHGDLGNCKEMPCSRRNKCTLSTSKSDLIKNHGEHFRIDCNFCMCNAGDLVCTKRRCPPDKISSSGQTGLACDCARNYAPRCGKNGRTYPNDCIARSKRCGGMKSSQLTLGACHSTDPCSDNPCGDDFMCMPKRKVCLSIKTERCLQYECVPLYKDCDKHFHDPVCSTDGMEYTNPCMLLYHGKELAYRGHCQNYCSTSTKACGHNGETYDSECAALADRTTVDYYGPCRAVGHFSGNLTDNECLSNPTIKNCINECEKITCPPVVPSNCQPLTPPGACCPVCAAELRALYKTDIADEVAEATMSGPVTVHSILNILSRQLEVAECDVFGYLNVESDDLVILVKSVVRSPTMLQVEACVREAERIAYLIQTDNPLLKSYMTLTPLLLAPMRAPSAISTSSGSNFSQSVTSIVLFLLIYIVTSKFRYS